MPIKGITNQYRPVRLGKIHLGVMQKHPKTQKEYPVEVDYFVIPDELKPFYGEKPKALNIRLPSAYFDKNFDGYLEKVFPQYLKRYQGGKDYGVLVCKGDGETAIAIDPESKTGLAEKPCPCPYLEDGTCKRIGIFRFRIQEMPSLNIYQITTSSFNSILNINSFCRDLLEHCLTIGADPSFYHLVLRRSEQKVQRLEKGEAKSSRHYILTLDIDQRYHKSLFDVSVPKAIKEESVPAAKLPPPDESRDERFFPAEQSEPEAASTEIMDDSQPGQDSEIAELTKQVSELLDEAIRKDVALTQAAIDKIDEALDTQDKEKLEASIVFLRRKIEKAVVK